MSRVYVALTRDRWQLRRAARHAGSPKLKRRLRRLAFRRAQQTRELAESVPSLDSGVEEAKPDSFDRDIGRANEISTVASCLRSNRRLQAAIEKALATSPSDKTTAKLKRLQAGAANEAGLLEARLREIAIRGFEGSPPIVE
jgi:hypothetical protein